MKTYATAKAYRAALESKISEEKLRSGKDTSRLRKTTVFDAFLERINLSSNDFVLKGGYALELRLDLARSTKDLDFGLRNVLRAILSKSNEKIEEAILPLLETAMERKTGGPDDFFSFRIERSRIMDEQKAHRFKVSAMLDGRNFENFVIDVGIGDTHGEEATLKHTSLAKIGVEGKEGEFDVAIVTAERHYAEKIHAYTLPRDRENSRVKDLVDLYLLIQNTLNPELLREALNDVFRSRSTHVRPDDLEVPPLSWNKPYAQLAKECKIELSIVEIFDFVARHYLSI